MRPSDLKPRGVAVNLVPGLPAFILFMCLRHADYANDDQRVSTLLNTTINSVKSVIKVGGRYPPQSEEQGESAGSEVFMRGSILSHRGEETTLTQCLSGWPTHAGSCTV